MDNQLPANNQINQSEYQGSAYQPPPSNNQGTNYWKIGVIIFAFLFLITLLVFVLNSRKEQNVNQITTKPSVAEVTPTQILLSPASSTIFLTPSSLSSLSITPTQDVTTGWKTYTNKNLNVSFLYPD